MKCFFVVFGSWMLSLCYATSSFGIGWDEDDFIVTGARKGIAVFDADWSFKGYVDECPVMENCIVTGLDFDAAGNLVSAWAEDTSGGSIRTYRQSDGSSVDQFSVPLRDGVVQEIKVGPNGHLFAAKTSGPIREYTPQGGLVRTFDDPALDARRVGSLSRITESSNALAVLSNGEIWASEATQAPLSYVYAFDPVDLSSAGPVFVGDLAPEDLTEPVSADSVILLRASSLQYLPASDTILAHGSFRDSSDDRRTLTIWEIAAASSQLVTVESSNLVGQDTREVQYRQLVNRYDSELTLDNPTGVTRGPNGDVFATAFGNSVHRWAYGGEYLREQSLVADNGETFGFAYNILWAGNSPQFSIPEPSTLLLLATSVVLLATRTA